MPETFLSYFIVRKRSISRIGFIYVIFTLLFLLLSARIIYLQVVKKSSFSDLARRQHIKIIPLNGQRGIIFDSKGRVLATNINVYSVYADPGDIEKKGYVAKILAQNLHLDEAKVLGKLRKKCHFVWIKRKVSLYDKKTIENFKLKGVYFLKERMRFYPQGRLVSHVLGGVNVDNKGIEGVELFYDKFLKGKEGFVSVLRDSLSRNIFIYPQIFESKKGLDLYLTVDAQVEYWVDKYLRETVHNYLAKAGSVIVVDSYTGAIIALANYPGYDPNNISFASSDSMRDRAAVDIFEPGSVFKIVTLVGALDKRIFSLDDRIYCEKGAFKIPGSVLHDWKPFGELTFKEAFKKSSNIGVAKIAHKLGPKNLYFYIRRLGFGKTTGIDLPGEQKGLLKPLRLWSDTSGYIVPIGQEVGVTVLQLARAMCVVANGGYLVKLHLCDKLKGDYGFVRKTRTRKVKVLSSRVASLAKNILIEVVNDGTGKLARIKGVTVGGKTGTAQKFDTKTGRYSHSAFRASFVGFVEYRGRSFVICVSIDEPHRSHFGGVVAAPLFKKIAQKLVKYESINNRIEVGNDY